MFDSQYIAQQVHPGGTNNDTFVLASPMVRLRQVFIMCQGLLFMHKAYITFTDTLQLLQGRNMTTGKSVFEILQL